MLPLELIIENFCALEHAYINFSEFSSAVVIGKLKENDKYSNGAGKSTIFYAILYALYNKTNFSTLDKIVRWGQDSCKVIYTFLSCGKIYKIERSKVKKSESDVRLYVKNNENWEDITGRRNSDTEKEIAKIIKINHKAFSNSVLFSQADLSGLATSLPSKRKELLKEALNLSIYAKYEELAKEKSKLIFEEIKTNRTIISTIGNPEEDIKHLKTKLDFLLLDQTKSKLDLKESNDSLVQTGEEFEKIRKIFSEHENKNKSYNDTVSDSKKIEISILEYEKKIKDIVVSGKTISSNIEELHEALKSLESKKFRSKESIENEINILSKESIDFNINLNSLKNEFNKLKIPLPDSDVCDSCRQTITIDRDSCQAKIDNRIYEIETLIPRFKESLSKNEKNIESNKNELKLINSTQNSILMKREQLLAKEKELQNKRSIYSELEEIINKYKSSLEEKRILIKNHIVQDSKEIEVKYNSIINSIKSIKLKIESITSDSQKISNEAAITNHNIENKLNDIEKLKLLNSNLISLEYKLKINQKTAVAFGSNGIPTLIIHTVLDDLQENTNKWISKLRPGIQSKFSVVKDSEKNEDTFDISYFIEGNEVEFAQLSGAQKFTASLSLKLGLLETLKKRQGIDIKFILVDEVDQAIDEGGIDNFDSVMKELQKDFKVLIITHNKDLRDRYTTAIVVEQDENLVSTAKVIDHRNV